MRQAFTTMTLLLVLSACGAGGNDLVIRESQSPPPAITTAPNATGLNRTAPPAAEPPAADPPATAPVETAPPMTTPPMTTPPTTGPAETFLPREAEAVANGLGDITYDLPACPDSTRGAVTDKANQRYWLCMEGVAVTDEIAMTTASGNYGLPPVGTYEVFARDEDAFGLGGEALERFVAFYTTPKGNRIAFHEVVDQDPATVGDLDQRGASAGCFRVREADSVQVWEFLQIGDPVVVLTN